MTGKHAFGVKWSDINWWRIVDAPGMPGIKVLEIRHRSNRLEIVSARAFNSSEVNENELTAFIERFAPVKSSQY